jgi:hypothetical protein
MKEEVRHRDLLKGIFSASGGNGLLYEMRLGLDGEMTGRGAYGDVMVAVFDLAQGKRERAADAYAKWLLMKNCEKMPGTSAIFCRRGCSIPPPPGRARWGHEWGGSRPTPSRKSRCLCHLKPYLAAAAGLGSPA